MMNLRREVASKYFKQYGVRLDPEREVLVCLGSKEGFSHMCLALIGPGDTAIVPGPSYPAHLFAVALAGGNAIALEVSDRRSTCRTSLIRASTFIRPKVADRQFPTQPLDGYRRAGVLCGSW